MQHQTATEFAEDYVRQHLTFEQVLAVPGVLRLVKNARWTDIIEAYELARANPLSPHPGV